MAVKEDEKLLGLVDGEIRMKKKNKEITSTSQLMQALGTMGEVLARADQMEDVTFLCRHIWQMGLWTKVYEVREVVKLEQHVRQIAAQQGSYAALWSDHSGLAPHYLRTVKQRPEAKKKGNCRNFQKGQCPLSAHSVIATEPHYFHPYGRLMNSLMSYCD